MSLTGASPILLYVSLTGASPILLYVSLTGASPILILCVPYKGKACPIVCVPYRGRIKGERFGGCLCIHLLAQIYHFLTAMHYILPLLRNGLITSYLRDSNVAYVPLRRKMAAMVLLKHCLYRAKA